MRIKFSILTRKLYINNSPLYIYKENRKRFFESYGIIPEREKIDPKKPGTHIDWCHYYTCSISLYT